MLGFDSDGKFLNSWGEGRFNYLHGLLIIPDNISYCTYDKNHTTRKGTLDGKVLVTLGTKDRPSDTGYHGKDWHTIARGGPPFSRPICSSITENFSI